MAEKYSEESDVSETSKYGVDIQRQKTLQSTTSNRQGKQQPKNEHSVGRLCSSSCWLQVGGGGLCLSRAQLIRDMQTRSSLTVRVGISARRA